MFSNAVLCDSLKHDYLHHILHSGKNIFRFWLYQHTVNIFESCFWRASDLHALGQAEKCELLVMMTSHDLMLKELGFIHETLWLNMPPT